MRSGISSEGLVPLLEETAGEFMTVEERLQVTSELNDPKKVSRIIAISQEKTDKDYIKFCKTLNQSGNEHWRNQFRQDTLTGQLCVSQHLIHKYIHRYKV